MKNIINYYYSLQVENIKNNGEKYYFKLKQFEYVFEPFHGDYESMLKSYMILNRSKRYCHEIIINKDGLAITMNNNTPYILIKKNLDPEKKLELADILNWMIPTPGNLKWKNLWKEKIDYYEYQVGQINIDSVLIKESFDYYLGMWENAISMLNYVNTDNIVFSTSHTRFKTDEKSLGFYNPTNLMIDSRIRDIAEFIKYKIIIEEKDQNEINQLISLVLKINLTKDEIVLLISRMLYPSFYFDIYDSLIEGKSVDYKLKRVIQKSLNYETMLKRIYNNLKLVYDLPCIEWLCIK